MLNQWIGRVFCCEAHLIFVAEIQVVNGENEGREMVGALGKICSKRSSLT